MAPSREGGMRRRVMVVKMKERILVTKVALRLDRKATIVGLLQSFKPHRLNNKYDVVVVSFLVGLAGRWRKVCNGVTRFYSSKMCPSSSPPEIKNVKINLAYLDLVMFEGSSGI